ncbi:MAG: hypothetical protein ACE5GZ_06160 [Gammaproteobacteria bacterium]
MESIKQIMHNRERPVNVVPVAVIVILICAFSVQLAWHAWRPSAVAKVSKLPDPPPAILLRALDLGEPVTLSRILMLWLQSFDYQPGISIPFKNLDYNRLIGWLQLVLDMDNKTQYPLLSASRLYSEVPDEVRQRQILEFVYLKFLENPNARWPWLVHAVYVAKHKLKDLDLAYKYAKALRVYANGDNVPSWARQMELFILDDQGDSEGARILLGGLLESGVIKDRNELRFLQERLGIHKSNNK